MRPRPNRIVAELSDTIPFVAPEEFERQMGRPFLARLGANESVFGASPLAVEAMAKTASQTQWYGDPLSHELRSELAFRFGTSIDHFVVGPGIDGLFGHIASAYFEPRDKVVTTLGSYPTFNYFVDAVGAELVQVPYKNLAVDLHGLAEAAETKKAKAVYIANPDNPSGAFHSKQAIQGFLHALPESVLVILDEAYVDFVEAFDVADPRLIRLRTFSKIYGMAGSRIGYAMGEPATVQPLNRIRPHFEVNLVAQAGALASLRDHDFVPRIRQQADEAKQSLMKILKTHGFATVPPATNFVLGDAGSKARAEEIVAKLREKDVFIRKPALPPLDHFIRVTIGTNREHEVLASAMAEILG